MESDEQAAINLEMGRLGECFRGFMADYGSCHGDLETLMGSMNPVNSEIIMDAFDMTWWNYGEEFCLQDPGGTTRFILQVLDHVIAASGRNDLQVFPHMELCRLAVYFQYLRNMKPVPLEAIDLIREWIYQKLKLQSNEIEHMLVCGFMEHALVDAQARSFFKEWMIDPVTVRAYEAGIRCADRLNLCRGS